MSATTVTEEYWRAHEHLDFTWDELARIALYGFESAFLSHQRKQAMVAEIRAEIETLTARYEAEDAAAATPVR